MIAETQYPTLDKVEIVNGIVDCKGLEGAVEIIKIAIALLETYPLTDEQRHWAALNAKMSLAFIQGYTS